MNSSKCRLGLVAGLVLVWSAEAGVGAAEALIQKTVTVKPEGMLVVESDTGSIEIRSGTANEVRVEVEREAKGGWFRGGDVLDRHRVEVVQEGDRVVVRSGWGGVVPKWGWGGGGLKVQHRITVPKSFSLDLKTAGGGIDAADLDGSVKARTSGGSIRMGAVSGRQELKTSGGSIRVADAGGDVDATTSGGGIHLASVKGRVVARTSGGGIEAAKLLGEADLRTSGGSIRVEATEKSLSARTSGGSIRARFTGVPAGESRLETSGGSVQVQIPRETGWLLDARTSGGSCSSDAPVSVSGTVGRSSLVGPIAGGGPLLHLRTSGGSIRVTH